MELTWIQKQTFYEQGYLQIPGVVPPLMVQNALKAINGSLGRMGIDPEKLDTFRSQSYCPEIQKEPVITGLLNQTPALTLAESLVGIGKIKPVGAGQVALRFPSLQAPPPRPTPHIDGTYSPHNGVPKGELHSFTMLVAVLLSDLTHDFAGNFTVWPGTHAQIARYFRENGSDGLLNGMPPIALPEPVQIKGKAGDIVFAHYELAHTAAINVSPHTRYAIFFRLSHIDHSEQKWECLTDLWREWPGLREFTQKEIA